METLIEILLDLILDGSMELVGCQKVPMPLRILAAVILGILCIGFGLLGIALLYSGTIKLDTGLVLCGLIILVCSVFFVLYLFKIWRKSQKMG